MTPLSESEQRDFDEFRRDAEVYDDDGMFAIVAIVDRLLSESSEGVVVLDGKRWRVGKPRREYCGCDRFASVDCGPACSCGHESAAHAPPPFDDCRASVSVARLIPADPEPPKTEGA